MTIHSYPSWKDKLYSASFRGVPFHVENVDSRIGRRNVVHQFPFREDAYSEDLGADADEFVIRGYVAQKRENDWDYFAERDALIEALQANGSGELIHPFLGNFNVTVKGKATITESFREGGMARFEMTFVKVKATPVAEGNIKPSFISKIDDAAESAFGKMKDSFHDMRAKFDSSKIGGVFYSVANTASDVTQGFQMIGGVFGKVTGTISSTVSSFRKVITDGIASITNTVRSACNLGNLILDMIDAPLAMIGIPDPISQRFIGACSLIDRRPAKNFPGDSVPLDTGNSMVDSFIQMNGFGESSTELQTFFSGYNQINHYESTLDDITISNFNTAAQSIDRIYVTNMIRGASLINATRVAVRMEIDSYEKMTDMITKVTDAMDDLIIKMADESADTTYSDYGLSIDNTDFVNAMEETRSNFVQVMRQKGASLAKIIEYKVPPTVLPTLVLAYDQYGDASREEEIFLRNKLIANHPGFLPGGELIDILNE